LAFVTTPSPSWVAVCSSLHSVPSPDFPSLGPRPCEIPTGVDGPSLFNVVACKIMMYVFRSQLSPCVPIVETGQSRTPSPLERRLRRRPPPPHPIVPSRRPPSISLRRFRRFPVSPNYGWDPDGGRRSLRFRCCLLQNYHIFGFVPIPETELVAVQKIPSASWM
jgi:hypothetical protein